MIKRILISAVVFSSLASCGSKTCTPQMVQVGAGKHLEVTLNMKAAEIQVSQNAAGSPNTTTDFCQDTMLPPRSVVVPGGVPGMNYVLVKGASSCGGPFDCASLTSTDSAHIWTFGSNSQSNGIVITMQDDTAMIRSPLPPGK